MSESSGNPNIQPCAGCATLVDTADAEPLAEVNCPTCGRAMIGRTQFHHFKLIKVLGSGGVGSVYQALDESLNRMVALKLLRTEHMGAPAIVAQFEREASITASINHPHVVRVYSTGLDHGIFYIAMELVDKGSLDDQITTLRRVGEAHVLDVGIQITQGLQAALKAGLIHRDVKPGNILFSDAHTAKLVDFGLATPSKHAGEVGGEVWGTPYYVAPEKLDSPPAEDFRSDMYSLGSSLFHALTGRPPYDANDASIVVLKVLKSRPVKVQSFAPEISNATAFVIDRMLLKQPNQRYQSYDDLLEHLRFARAELTRAHRQPLTGKPQTAGKSSLWATLSMVALVVLIGGLFFLPNRKEKSETPAPPPAENTAAVDLVAIEQKIADARKLLLTADPAAAQRAAESLQALSPTVRTQPLLNWIDWQEGLAQLLAGNGTGASAAFRKIAERGPFSTAPEDERIAKFFVEAGTAAADNQRISPTAAPQLDPATHEAMALLVHGVKNWQLGESTQAVPFLERFQSATPPGHVLWMAEYGPLAARLLAEYVTFKTAADAAASANGAPEKMTAALAAVRTAQGQLTLQGPLPGQLAALETQLAAEIAAVAKSTAEMDVSDERMLAPLRPLIESHCQKLSLEDARAMLEGLKLNGGKAQPEVELIRRKIGWLTAFKNNLVSDINLYGYTGEFLKSPDGKANLGQWKATESTAIISTKFGTIPRPWRELSPPILVAVAESFFRRALTPEQIADRKWYLGIYLLNLHRDTEARGHLTEASAAKPEFLSALRDLGLAPAP